MPSCTRQKHVYPSHNKISCGRAPDPHLVRRADDRFEGFLVHQVRPVPEGTQAGSSLTYIYTDTDIDTDTDTATQTQTQT